MLFKHIFLLLSAFLLVQCTFGRAVQSSKESIQKSSTETQPEKSETSSEETADEHTELLIFVLSGLSDLADVILEDGHRLLKDVVAEAAKIEDKSADFSARIDEYSQLVEKIEDLQENHGKLNEAEEMEEKFNATIELSELMEKSNITALENPSEDDKKLHELLQKHGIEALEHKFMQHFEKFSDEFEQEADKFWKSLSSEQKEKHAQFDDWYKNYKAQENVEKKIELFEHFFETIQY